MSDQSTKLLLSIDLDGTMQFIYTDELASLLEEGKSSVRRVSNVEPHPDGGWAASMEDGTVLGPFKLRSEALAEEIKYLERKMFDVNVLTDSLTAK